MAIIDIIPISGPDGGYQLNPQGNDVDIWCVTLDVEETVLQSLYPILSEDEQGRAQRFLVEKPRKHFVAARGFLRLILGRYLDVKPESLRFQYGPNGKPSLMEEFAGKGISFNLSHSHGLALYAVTWGRVVGVDIERISPDLAYMELAERFFSQNETKELQQLYGDKQRQGFFNCWTRKEAYLKATGEGISAPLDGFDVSLIPGEPAALLVHRLTPQEVSRWVLEDLKVPSAYAAALAVEKPQGDIRYFYSVPLV